MRRMVTGIMMSALLGGAAVAQQAGNPAVPPPQPPNEQMVQYYRALLATGGTQAVVQAVSQAVIEALRQGPMTAPAAQQTLAASANAVPATVTAPTAATPAPVLPKTWTDFITLKGDLRVRQEFRQDHAKNATDPNANVDYDRLRARIGAEAKVCDNVKAVVRLTTDSSAAVGTGGDPISGNQDMNNGASKKSIYLDLAYLDWNFFGGDANSLHGLAGKMVNPFITMPDDLAWDPDLTPEGFALKGQLDLDPVTLYGNGAYFILNNRNSATARDDQLSMYGAQGAARIEFMPEVALTLGLSYYGYQNIQGQPVVDIMNATPSSYGNTTRKVVSGKTTNTLWATDFREVQPFAQLDVWCWGLPVSLYLQGIQNLAADDLNAGYMTGVTVGKARNPDTWELGASYAKLEKDATLGMWTDSDRWGGGTNGEGYKLYAKYMFLKNLMGQITYFNDNKGIAAANGGTGYERWQMDLTAFF